MTILHSNTSLRQDRSVSRELTMYTMDLIGKGATMEIDRLDLNVGAPNPITQAFLDALGIQVIHLLKVEATVFYGEERNKQSIAKARKEIQIIVDQLKSRQR